MTGEKDTISPLEDYLRTKSQNKLYFSELSRASSIDEKVKITTKFTGQTIKVKPKTIFMEQKPTSKQKSVFDG